MPPAPQLAPPSGSELSEADFLSLEASWIDRPLAVSAMLRRVSSFEGQEVIGQRGRDCAGILYPYYLPGEKRHHACRLRRDHPDLEKGRDGTVKQRGKYLTAPGDRNRLYVPPLVPPEHLGDVSIPLLIVEGEKKALSAYRLSVYEATQPRFIPVSIPGVWGWRGVTGKVGGPSGERLDVKGPIPDLDWIQWPKRRVFVLFDSNVISNPSVARARELLVQELSSRGAAAELIELPQAAHVNGIDDFLAVNGPDAALELFRKSRPTVNPKTSKTQLLIDLAKDVTLFHSPELEAFASVPQQGHRENLALRSTEFRLWLTARYYETVKTVPAKAQVEEALSVLAAQARFGCPERQLFVRSGRQRENVYVDLCDAKRQIVEISPSGWRILPEAPIYFRRPRGMRPLPIPAIGGSITTLRRYLNLETEADWILCATWLLSAINPSGPFPILMLRGEQGSAKSTTARILRMLIDPSVAPLRVPPGSPRDLAISARNSWLLSFDNLSGISPSLSDAFCRLSTGGGFATRELYADTEEVYFDACRPILLNGIDSLAERPDLAERSLHLPLPVIPNSRRLDEASLNGQLAAELPLIYGAVLTCLAGMYARLPDVILDEKPRMADFARLGVAAEECLGLQPGRFSSAYSDNRREIIEDTLDNDPLAVAVIALLGSHRFKWTGTCKDLLATLDRSADRSARRSGLWPVTPRSLSTRLGRIATFLRQAGIEYTPPKRIAKGHRILTLQKMAQPDSATHRTPQPMEAQEVPEGNDLQGKVEIEYSDFAPPPSHFAHPAIATLNPLKPNEVGAGVTEVAETETALRVAAHTSGYRAGAQSAGEDTATLPCLDQEKGR